MNIVSTASATTPVTATTTTATSAAATVSANQTVNATDFMQLLSTEMSNQDPLQPMDPTQTLSQLAQFSTLSDTSQLNQYQSLAAANSFLGTQVTIPGTNGAAATVGTVTAIDSSGVAAGNSPELIVSGASQEYPLTAISQVTVPSSASTSSSSSTSSSTPATTATVAVSPSTR